MEGVRYGVIALIRSLAIAILAAGVAGAAGLLFLHSHGVRLLSVQTGSMAPTLEPGDAVVVQRLEGTRLRPGDIISYHSLSSPPSPSLQPS